jgi:protein-disulfide isomerase
MRVVGRSQVRRVAVGTFCLMGAIAVATSGMSQEAVHQILQQIGPGQAKGSATAPVLVEEFSDFQCAYCGKFSRETLPRLMETYVDTGKVRWIFRHFAILGLNSQAAAEASACAGAQKQFWPYHDGLYAALGQRAFTRENLRRMAQELHLDLVDFTDCLDSGRFRAQVQAETNAAIAIGLQGTPGFVINGRPMAGALPFELFQSVIDEALTTAISGPSPAPQAGQPATQPPSK